jgi:hypothetical protein
MHWPFTPTTQNEINNEKNKYVWTELTEGKGTKDMIFFNVYVKEEEEEECDIQST